MWGLPTLHPQSKAKQRTEREREREERERERERERRSRAGKGSDIPWTPVPVERERETHREVIAQTCDNQGAFACGGECVRAPLLTVWKKRRKQARARELRGFPLSGSSAFGFLSPFRNGGANFVADGPGLFLLRDGKLRRWAEGTAATTAPEAAQLLARLEARGRVSCFLSRHLSLLVTHWRWPRRLTFTLVQPRACRACRGSAQESARHRGASCSCSRAAGPSRVCTTAPVRQGLPKGSFFCWAETETSQAEPWTSPPGEV